ncbi:MAG TPA: UDP-3-O-(3-hydroxymyristoyl)glucosamine N-acyltransferase [Caulobacteraceae bacterium]|jgi:UDP-3-O-[3-hydroxymyristoyl] glucosamine N-acyltransferase
MPDRRFFEHAGPFALADLAGLSGIAADPASAGLQVYRAAPLVRSDERSVSFLSDRKFLPDLAATKAAAVFLPEAFRDAVPNGCVAMVTREPQAAWARAAGRLHPLVRGEGQNPIHPSAEIEEGVDLGPSVTIGPGARIGRGTVIRSQVVIGPGVAIGRDCDISSFASVHCSLVGDRVQLSAGVRVGEPGFGVAPSARGAVSVPQLGRAILQDGVAVGSNTCIDRGAFDDTVIGENTKIDNLVQIGHNTVVGRNCALAGQCGISGSVTIGDGVMMGGQVGVADHVTIGSGTRIAGNSGVIADVPGGVTWGGFPAQPLREWARQMAWLRRYGEKRGEGERE